MKKLLFFLFFCAVTYSQNDKFIFTNEGFTDFIVKECPGKTQSELYKKSIDWLAVTYNNPKEVLKAQIENDYIRFEGSSPDLVTFSNLMTFTYRTTYQVEISFKEGKYKFDVIEVKYYIAPNQYGTGGWQDFPLDTNSVASYYKKNGTIKGNYKYMPEKLTSHFNKLNESLFSFFMSDSIPSKKSDW